MDTRRYCEGVRLHLLLGGILSCGAGWLRTRIPGKQIRNDLFNRAVIPQLASRGFVYKIEASKLLPKDLRWALAEMAKRRDGSAIWFPTDEFAGKWIFVRDELMPRIVDDRIVIG